MHNLTRWVLLVIFALAAWGTEQATADDHEKGDIVVDRPLARVSPPKAMRGAAFSQTTNKGRHPGQFNDVKSDRVERTEPRSEKNQRSHAGSSQRKALPWPTKPIGLKA